ncbi:GIN domain-containing protein [uncultured Sphingomonas sp.]|uniref:GIN domain-containing protein n=1 Tax=uncultured Sphingomonas sp. TaxID=158754 RepID=UPI0035CB8418
MIRALLLLALIATPANAAERRVAIGSFDRVRIDGPFEVHIDTGRSPGGTIAGEASAIETVELQTDGNTLVIRRGIGGWAEQHRAAPTTPIVVRLGTIDLAGALVVAGGTLSVTKMRGDRIDLSVTGAGSIVVGEASGDSLNATVIGAGTIGIAGRTGRARLATNGTGTIDAAALDAGDLFVRLDGPGTIQARARYTATVDDVGLGRVTVLGDPKCTVRAAAGGPVACGPAQ